MTPVEKAAAVYDRFPTAFTFKRDLEFYLLNGFVFSRPDFFIMGRPVVSTATAEEISGHHRFSSAACDCWHMYLAAGNLSRMWAMLPWELPLVSFQRGNELRFAKLSSMRRLSTSSRK
jgi:hypothetical protein